MTLSEEKALVELGSELRRSGYRFTTITPDSHRRVNARPDNAQSRSPRDAFGWNRPFSDTLLPPHWLGLLRQAGMAQNEGQLWRSKVRFSTVGSFIFAHSPYPTLDLDAVFFGPDTSRFLAFLDRAATSCKCVVDVGCGSGAGGLSIANRAGKIVLADINPRALQFARINAALNDVGDQVELVESNVLVGVSRTFDLVIANPPYLIDEMGRTYRDGGGFLGTDLSVRIAQQALERLGPGGRLLLYTGSPIVDGEDILLRRLLPLCTASGANFHYSELDPDVFGEELETRAYQQVDRIAVVALQATVQAH